MFNISENPSHFSGSRQKTKIVHTSDEIRKSFTLLAVNRRKSKIAKKIQTADSSERNCWGRVNK